MTKLEKIEYSNCCQAPVTDQWLCSDCKDHCSTIVTQDVSVWVLDYTTPSVKRIITTIEYDDDDWDLDTAVEEKLAELYPNCSLERMYKDWEEVDFEDLDYR